MYGPVAYMEGGDGWGLGAPSKRGTFFKLQVYEDIRVGKSVISVCKKPKRLTDALNGCEEV